MKEISVPIRNAVFYALIAVFAVVIINVTNLAGGLVKLPFPWLAGLAIALGLLGLVLVVLTVRLRESRIRKMFFILTGASAAGIPIFAILHNVVFGLFKVWFGEDFWAGGDEAVFFILALLVCPVLFLIGAVGSVVLAVKAGMVNRRDGGSAASLV